MAKAMGIGLTMTSVIFFFALLVAAVFHFSDGKHLTALVSIIVATVQLIGVALVIRYYQTVPQIRPGDINNSPWSRNN
ncbi:MAG: hypothetical protein AAB568_03045 [Patescibacteria group bacterium]